MNGNIVIVHLVPEDVPGIPFHLEEIGNDNPYRRFIDKSLMPYGRWVSNIISVTDKVVLSMRAAGERIVIRPIEKENLPVMLPWWNDPEVMYYANDDPSPHRTLQELEEEFAKEKSEWSATRETFVIETKDGTLIGDIVYRWYRSDVRSVYMGIVIGEKEYWGQGYGTEAIKLFLRHLFVDKQMHKVAVTVSDFNKRAIRVYEKCGFRKDGVLRDNVIINGEFVDHIVMSILEDEYRSTADDKKQRP